MQDKDSMKFVDMATDSLNSAAAAGIGLETTVYRLGEANVEMLLALYLELKAIRKALEKNA